MKWRKLEKQRTKCKSCGPGLFVNLLNTEWTVFLIGWLIEVSTTASFPTNHAYLKRAHNHPPTNDENKKRNYTSQFTQITLLTMNSRKSSWQKVYFWNIFSPFSFFPSFHFFRQKSLMDGKMNVSSKNACQREVEKSVQ